MPPPTPKVPTLIFAFSTIQNHGMTMQRINSTGHEMEKWHGWRITRRNSGTPSCTVFSYCLFGTVQNEQLALDMQPSLSRGAYSKSNLTIYD